METAPKPYYQLLTGLFLLGGLLALIGVTGAQARTVYKSEFVFDYDNSSDKWVLDRFNDQSSDVALKFGTIGNGQILFDAASNVFRLSNDLSLEQNQLRNVVIDNLAAAPNTPLKGQIYYNTTDNNTYVWNNNIWEDITATGAVVTPKIVTVGAGVGMDYSTIPAAAAYLNSAGGGIMILSAGTFSITGGVNLSNITLYGKGESKTVISLSGAGKLNISDTTFGYLHLDINTITASMGLDLLTGTSSLQLEFVRLSVQDTGDSLIDSTAGTAPTVNLHFVNCEVLQEAGTILKLKASSNINTASSVFVFGANGSGLLNIQDWNVTMEGEGNVYTTGVMSTVPSNTIFVYPGMSLQGAVNSLPSGGIITLLPGTHTINQPLQISNSNIKIEGYGDASILMATGFTGITTDTAAIQVGANTGTAPVNAVELTNFTLNVNGDFHGIRVAGGTDNSVKDMTVRKLSVQGGSGATAKIGIQFLDSTTAPLQRASIINNRVLGNGGTNYFTDGIHVTALSGTGGIWGYNQGITNSLIEGNVVDYVRETAYVLVRADSTNLFNNRASRMGVGGGAGAYGIFIAGVTDVNMNANVFSGSLNTGTIAVGIEPFGLNLTTSNSIFNNNVIDGTGNGGVGFTTGLQLGNATNAQVHRNSFQNNTIAGADNTTTTAIVLRGNADDNAFSNNSISGGTNAWDTGIDIQAAAAERNTVEANRFTSTTTMFNNVGTATKLDVPHVRAITNPTVTDDRNDGYYVGTIWINTLLNQSYILSNDTVGLAVWTLIAGGVGGGHTQNTDTGTNANTFILNNDGSAGDVALQFGTTLGTLTYDTTNNRFKVDKPLRVQGDTTIAGEGFIADNDTATASDGTLNLGRLSNAWQSFSFDSTNNTFTTNNTQLTTRIRQASTPPFACAAAVAGTLWMDTDTGILYICDNTRNKWLSTQDTAFLGENTASCSAGDNSVTDDACTVKWGANLGSDTASDLGVFIPYNATIVGYGFSEDNDACTSGSLDVEIYSTGSSTNDNNYTTLTDVATGLTGEVHNATNLNIDIAGGQYILWGIDNNCGQSIDDFNIVLYLRWRS